MITKKQIAALRYLIFNARGERFDMPKRIAAILLAHSKNLTRSVHLTLHAGRLGLSGEEVHKIAVAFGGFNSCNSDLHLAEVLQAMGTEMHFDVHYGHTRRGILNTEGIFGARPQNAFGHEKDRARPTRYTFWITPGRSAHKGKLIKVTRKMLEAVDLKKPGLYPDLENQNDRP